MHFFNAETDNNYNNYHGFIFILQACYIYDAHRTTALEIRFTYLGNNDTAFLR
jgi:hypothetical protein